MCDYTFFSKDPSWWNEAYQSLWGCHDICPILEQFHVVQVTQIRALFSHLLTGMGWPQKISQQCCLSTDIAQRGYHRTEGVWACYGVGPPLSSQSFHHRQHGKTTHPAGPNWPYAFVQFNGDTHHMPLPKEGHLGTMAEGMPSNIPCGRICQLEAHQLLHLEAWVVYPKGLNGCLVLVVATLPELLSHSVTMPDDEPTFLQVDILQFTTDGHGSKTPLFGND